MLLGNTKSLSLSLSLSVKMKSVAQYENELHHLRTPTRTKFINFSQWLFRFTVLHLNPLSTQILYFTIVSVLGFGVLRALKPRTEPFRPRNIDFFFTSVSATTVSSMSTVEMEVFSNTQLLVMTMLMFIGGEVFTSMVGLHLAHFKVKNRVNCSALDLPNSSIPTNVVDEIEPVRVQRHDSVKPISGENAQTEMLETEELKNKSKKFLGFVVLGYLMAIHVLGVAFLSVYLSISHSSRDVLKQKGLKSFTFSLFTIVSTFASCGFVPTNENMIVFKKSSGLLLILIPQILLGNTLFPSALRFSILVLGRFVKRVESDFLLKKTGEVGYNHLLPSLHSRLLVVTVLGFIGVQFVLFCSMEWNAAGLGGMNIFEKLIGILFQTVNSRHTGETIVDLSTISQAILVLFVVMMYLPPYTSFLPIKDDDEQENYPEQRERKVVDNFIFSQLSYLAIFTILVCITERERIKEDPLNFSVLNIVVEVISAYGNVGFSTGYSCARQLKPEVNCKDKWFGFSGKWSDQGKIVLIIVMFFGRLKKFNINRGGGGQAWKLL